MPSRPVNLAFSMHRCAIRGVEAVAADSSHAFPRHTHGQFGISIIDRGAQKSFSECGTVEAGAGDVITVNPLEVHDGTPIGDAGRAWRILYLDPGVVADTATDLYPGHYGDAKFGRPVIRDATLAPRVHLLFTRMTMPGARNDALLREQLLLSVLADTLYPANQPADHHIDAAPDAIRLVRTRIDDDSAAAISLPDLTRETGLSRFQVLRGFARVTGLVPHAYQVQRHVTLARRLIVQDEPLAEMAAACGFTDQSHMTRQSVRKYGVSPGMVAAAR